GIRPKLSLLTDPEKVTWTIDAACLGRDGRVIFPQDDRRSNSGCAERGNESRSHGRIAPNAGVPEVICWCQSFSRPHVSFYPLDPRLARRVFIRSSWGSPVPPASPLANAAVILSRATKRFSRSFLALGSAVWFATSRTRLKNRAVVAAARP